jgi:hypothetical protein
MYNRTTSFTALGPAMPIEKTIQFDCQPAQLWEIVGTPDRVDWVPGVTNCEFDGEVRSLSLPGAGAIKEKILRRDADAMHMQYSCIESPIPLQSHLAEIQISAKNGGTQMVWRTTVKPEEFEKFIEDSMNGAVEQLHQLLSP